MNLYNLVNHESSLPKEEKIRAAIRSVILLESLKRTLFFLDTIDTKGPLVGYWLLSWFLLSVFKKIRFQGQVFLFRNCFTAFNLAQPSTCISFTKYPVNFPEKYPCGWLGQPFTMTLFFSIILVQPTSPGLFKLMWKDQTFTENYFLRKV